MTRQHHYGDTTLKIGEPVHAWTITGFRGKTYAQVRCVCGRTAEVAAWALVNGRTRSCGKCGRRFPENTELSQRARRIVDALRAANTPPPFSEIARALGESRQYVFLVYKRMTKGSAR